MVHWSKSASEWDSIGRDCALTINSNSKNVIDIVCIGFAFDVFEWAWRRTLFRWRAYFFQEGTNCMNLTMTTGHFMKILISQSAFSVHHWIDYTKSVWYILSSTHGWRKFCFRSIAFQLHHRRQQYFFIISTFGWRNFELCCDCDGRANDVATFITTSVNGTNNSINNIEMHAAQFAIIIAPLLGSY